MGAFAGADDAAIGEELVGVDGVGGEWVEPVLETAVIRGGEVDGAGEAEVGAGGDVAEGGELGTILEAEDTRGSNVNLATVAVESISGDVAVFFGDSNDEAAIDGDISAVSACLGCTCSG